MYIHLIILIKNKILKDINNLPKFLSFDDEYDIYLFHKSGKEIHVFSNIYIVQVIKMLLKKQIIIITLKFKNDF